MQNKYLTCERSLKLTYSPEHTLSPLYVSPLYVAMLQATPISTNLRRYFYVLNLCLPTKQFLPIAHKNGPNSPMPTSFKSSMCNFIQGVSITTHILLTSVHFLPLFSLFFFRFLFSFLFHFFSMQKFRQMKFSCLRLHLCVINPFELK